MFTIIDDFMSLSTVQTYLNLYVKYSAFLSDFNQTGLNKGLKFYDTKFHENRSGGSRAIHMDKWKGSQT